MVGCVSVVPAHLDDERECPGVITPLGEIFENRYPGSLMRVGFFKCEAVLEVGNNIEIFDVSPDLIDAFI